MPLLGVPFRGTPQMLLCALVATKNEFPSSLWKDILIKIIYIPLKETKIKFQQSILRSDGERRSQYRIEISIRSLFRIDCKATLSP